MKSSTHIQSYSKSRIQGLTRQSCGQVLTQRPMAESQIEVKPLRRRGLKFTILELIVLAAGFGAFAALMTSCSSNSKKNSGMTAADSEPISTGLSRLADPKSKQPRLNTPVEISKDSDYQKLADQAKIDYENLFSRDPKKVHETTKSPEPESNAGPAKSGLKDLTSTKSEPLIALPEMDPSLTPPVKAASTPVAEVQPAPVVATAKKEEAPGAAAVPNPQATVTETKIIPPPEPVVPVFKGTNALLASRVTGYGRYVPLASRPGRGTFVFQSAQSNRAIVYVEIENFGYRAVRDSDPDKMPGDQWAVDLSTEIQLLDAFDGMLQMKEAERGVIETGRNKRKDFYVVQEIELPPTLTIGSYNLKIVLRDKSGAEPVRTEMIIPIQIVGDLAAILDN